MPSMGWILWDMGYKRIAQSDGELAFTSFQRLLKLATLNRCYIKDHGMGNNPTKARKTLPLLLENKTRPMLFLKQHVGIRVQFDCLRKYGIWLRRLWDWPDHYAAAKNEWAKEFWL